jgi:hypothetical protein
MFLINLVLTDNDPSLLMTDPNLTIVFRALRFVAEKHRDQRRKDDHGSPYINGLEALFDTVCLNRPRW